eukprot:5180630-Prymnesium_polylepis.2
MGQCHRRRDLELGAQLPDHVDERGARCHRASCVWRRRVCVAGRRYEKRRHEPSSAYQDDLVSGRLAQHQSPLQTFPITWPMVRRGLQTGFHGLFPALRCAAAA